MSQRGWAHRQGTGERWKPGPGGYLQQSLGAGTTAALLELLLASSTTCTPSSLHLQPHLYPRPYDIPSAEPPPAPRAPGSLTPRSISPCAHPTRTRSPRLQSVLPPDSASSLDSTQLQLQLQLQLQPSRASSRRHAAAAMDETARTEYPAMLVSPMPTPDPDPVLPQAQWH